MPVTRPCSICGTLITRSPSDMCYKDIVCGGINGKCYRELNSRTSKAQFISMPERFWLKVDKRGLEDCWEWKAGCDDKGYGRIYFDGKHCTTHRVSWTLENGSIPKGMCVLHRCDNPPCVNPAHLFLGTHGDNSKDAARKGRSRAPRGENANGAKLTVADVLEIRRRAKDASRGIKTQLAREFGVTDGNIGMIIRRESWAWLDD